MIIEQISLLIYIQHQIRRFCNTPQNKTFLGRNLSSFRQHLHRFLGFKEDILLYHQKQADLYFFPRLIFPIGGCDGVRKRKLLG